MKQGQFTLEPLGETVFEGHTQGEDWNGFACPYFTIEQAHRVVSAWDEAGKNAAYNETVDAFIFEPLDNTEEVEVFAAVEVEGQKFYPVGAGNWIWNEI